MLTQGSAQDLRCKLINSSFLTLPHLLDWLICTRTARSIVLLLQMMADGIGGACLIYISNLGEEGNRGWVSSYSFYFFLVLLDFFLFQVLSPFIWVARI